MKQAPFGGGRGENKDFNSLSDGVIRITAASWLGRQSRKTEPHRRLALSRDTFEGGMLRRGPGCGVSDWTWLVKVDGRTDGHRGHGSVYCLLDYSYFTPPEDHHGPGTRITQGNYQL